MWPPFAEGSVALPAPGAVPAPLVDGLSSRGRCLLEGWRQDMLLDLDAATTARNLSEVRRPFSDPSLLRDPAACGRLLIQLRDAGMIRLERRRVAHSVGIFFCAQEERATSDYL